MCRCLTGSAPNNQFEAIVTGIAKQYRTALELRHPGPAATATRALAGAPKLDPPRPNAHGAGRMTGAFEHARRRGGATAERSNARLRPRLRLFGLRRGWRAMRLQTFAILIVALSGPLSSVHATLHDSEPAGSLALLSHAHGSGGARSDHQDTGVPFGELQHQHCAACSCVHVYPNDTPTAALVCQEPVNVRYLVPPENDAATIAPEPPRKPPRA